MAYDPERFRRAYLPEALPIDLGSGFSIEEVRSDRLRSAIDLLVAHVSGEVVTVFVERASAGVRSFARTERLAISYYAERGMDDGHAAQAARLVWARLSRAEASADLGETLALDRAAPVTGRTRTLELRINRECNERCAFCNTPEDSDTIVTDQSAILSSLERERAAGYTHVTFTGREPTLDPTLPRYLVRARELGYETIRVQTNGTSFAHEPMLRRLIDAGMNTAEISLHTLDARTFRRLIGPPRLLDKTLEGLAHLSRTKVRVHIVVVLTRINLGDLPAVLECVAQIHPRIEQITLSPMAPVGDGEGRIELVPLLRELREPLRRAFETAARLGQRIRIPSRCGAPLCAMPEGALDHNDEMQNAPGQTLEQGKTKPSACRRCKFDPICTGLWKAYVDRHGEGEVSPIS
jgi:MoaA/NifB/PqqE/SkfB family radical SAM enzyme